MSTENVKLKLLGKFSDPELLRETWLLLSLKFSRFALRVSQWGRKDWAYVIFKLEYSKTEVIPCYTWVKAIPRVGHIIAKNEYL